MTFPKYGRWTGKTEFRANELCVLNSGGKKKLKNRTLCGGRGAGETFVKMSFNLHFARQYNNNTMYRCPSVKCVITRYSLPIVSVFKQKVFFRIKNKTRTRIIYYIICFNNDLKVKIIFVYAYNIYNRVTHAYIYIYNTHVISCVYSIGF